MPRDYVSPSPPTFLGVGDQPFMTVQNIGAFTIYYYNQQTVSSTVNSGSITAGSTATITAGQWFATASGTSQVQVSASTALASYDRDQKEPGMLAFPGWAGTGAATMVAGRALFTRFVPSRDMTITTIAFVVTTLAGADDAVDVGIYDAAGLRLVSSGATAGTLITTTGTKTVAVAATTLRAGVVYYAAHSCGTLGGSAAVVAAVQHATLGSDIFGATVPKLLCGFQNSAHPLPATASLTVNPATTTLLALRES